MSLFVGVRERAILGGRVYIERGTGGKEMKPASAIVVVFALSCVVAAQAGAQAKAAQSPNPVKLELAMEAATTTEDGLPAALRFTLTNVGNVAVDLPIPAIDCQGRNGTIRVRALIRLDHPGDSGSGHGCGYGIGDGPSLNERVKSSWLRLRPGEYLTFLGDRRALVDRAGGSATYEYWAAYDPPSLSAEERSQLAKDGYIAPTEQVESAHLTYWQP